MQSISMKNLPMIVDLYYKKRMECLGLVLLRYYQIKIKN